MRNVETTYRIGPVTLDFIFDATYLYESDDAATAWTGEVRITNGNDEPYVVNIADQIVEEINEQSDVENTLETVAAGLHPICRRTRPISIY